MVRIEDIRPGTIAEELSLQIGSRIVRINGERVRDGIDFRFQEVDPLLELEVRPRDGGPGVIYEIEKPAGEALGVVPAADTVRECANKCVFCFIDGNPPHGRKQLYMRDDDFRLSFTYGSYVTLTNLGPKGFQRLIDQKLSPLYVSVHATEPEVRMRLLGVPWGGDIMEKLERLVRGGLEVHTQVVLCPGWNDGERLDRTLSDLWSLGEGVLSLSVVPVGLTRYNLGRPVRLLTKSEAEAALDQVEAFRAWARTERGVGWVYAADELFLHAERAVPAGEYYDDWPLTENGVGAVRQLLDGLDGLVSAPVRVKAERAAIVTGTRMASLLEPRLGELTGATGAALELVPVVNGFFGETVTTAGLLAGSDILAALRGRGRFDAVLLPAESLNDADLFIDSMPLSELESRLAPARILPGYALSEALTRL